MLIRDIRQQDKQDYLAMSQDFYSGDATQSPVGQKNFLDTFEQAMQGSPLMRALILEEDGQTVGYGLLAFYWSNEAGGLVVQIEELYFLERCRGKGYGHQFFSWVKEAYPQARRFRLEVCQRNPRAKALYERLGYTELPYIQMIQDIAQ